MPDRFLVTEAAHNNAEWCDAFCRTHGITGYFDAGFWFSPVRAPPYYPDAVTLRPGIGIEQLLSNLDTSEGCSVKDSFADLDLAVAGFQPLFSAEWIVRQPSAAGTDSARQWSRVTNGAQLSAWEAAWGDFPRRSRFFRTPILEDEAICVLAGYDGTRVVAGAIANRSATVIGLSNVFDVGGDLASAWVTAADVARDMWGKLPTVGYDFGESLEAARRVGFESVGELVVWVKAPLPGVARRQSHIANAVTG